MDSLSNLTKSTNEDLTLLTQGLAPEIDSASRCGNMLNIHIEGEIKQEILNKLPSIVSATGKAANIQAVQINNLQPISVQDIKNLDWG